MNSIIDHDLQSSFNAVACIENYHILIACRVNNKPESGKAFVGGLPGGLYHPYDKAVKEGEGGVSFDPKSKESILSVFMKRISQSLPSGVAEAIPEQVQYLSETICKNISGSRALTSSKEGQEEVGVTITSLDKEFFFTQPSYHGIQNFYLAEKCLRYNGIDGEYEVMKDFIKQLPRLGIDYRCLDTDIDHVRAIPVSEIFSIKDLDILPAHRKPIMEAIAYYDHKRRIIK